MQTTTPIYRLIGKLFLLLLLVSCQQDNEYTRLLSHTDSIMYVHPDSALLLLNSIKAPQTMRAANRAWYALLLTQAKHKNWIDVTNDSLIQVAVEYYKDGKDKKQEARAYYYLGCIYDNMQNVVSATDAYLKALKIEQNETNDAKLLTMIYESLAECYRSQGFYSKAMEMYRTSYKTNIVNNEQKNILFPLQGIGEIFMYQEQWDSAAYYCNKVIEKSRMLGDSSWVSAGLNNLAHVYYNQKKYPNAYQAALRSIHKNPNYKDDMTSNYFLLGDILAKLGQYDSARYYLSLSRTCENIPLQAAINLVLYEVEKIVKIIKKQFTILIPIRL